MDKEKIKKAVREFLEAIGENPLRSGLKDTPERVARMCEEIFSSYSSSSAAPPVFFQAEKYSEIILMRDINFHSICENHLLTFYGNVHIAYIPREGKITGLSKMARLVDAISSRLQLQERMTGIIADSMMENLNPMGAMVIVEARHLCMIMRGVRKPQSKVSTSALRGIFLKDERKRT